MEKMNGAQILQLRINWSELDYFGHVNNVAFFKYIQAARVNYWELIGLNKMFIDSGVGAMLASCKCDFSHPLFFPGNIQLHTYVESMGNTSLVFKHAIYDHENVLCATATDIVVIYDYHHKTKISISEQLRNTINQLQHNSKPIQ